MKSLELFAGIGGISLAAEWAGIDTVAFCEREPYCQKVLNKHWPDVPIFDDVTTLDKSTLEERGVDVGAIELITGGFPCQPYSIAGKRQGTEDDRDLWPEMFRIIEEIRPRWVVGENVANFATMELDRTLFDLEPSVTKGARLYYRLVPSAPRTDEIGRLLWPTPNSWDAKRGPLSKKEMDTGDHMTNLITAVKHWPTPTSEKGMNGGEQARDMMSVLVSKGKISEEEKNQMLYTTHGGQLNPPWVEWLMGFPIGWTELEDLETQ